MKETTLEFYNEVRQDFSRYSEVREFGVLKHTKEWCLAKVAKKHRRSTKTVENIIFNRV